MSRLHPAGLLAGLGILLAPAWGCEPPIPAGADRAPHQVELRSDAPGDLLESLDGLGDEELRRVEDELARLPQHEAELQELMVRWRTLHPTAPLFHIRLVPHRRLQAPSARDEDEILVSAIALLPGAGVPDLPSEVMRQLVSASLPPPGRWVLGVSLPTRGPTLLEEAVREGITDVLTQMITGRHPAPGLHRWGSRWEAELWDDFRAVMHRRVETWAPDPDGESAGGEARPLRYMGQRIVESYWIRSPDRREALDELLELEDVEEILERSAYRGAGPAAPGTTRGLGLDTWPGFTCDRMRVGATRLQLCAAGTGPLTVVLEVGDELSHRVWGGVVQELAAQTRVVVYDRAGTGDSEPGQEPRTLARAAHERAGALEVGGGPGPYLLVAPPSLQSELEAFQALYPWRVAGRISLPVEDPRTDPELPAGLVEEVQDEMGRITGGSDPAVASTSPVARGEPVGCWQPVPPPAPASEAAPALLRLALTPRGGDPETGEGHVVLDVSGPHRPAGVWRPLGEGTLGLELTGVLDATLTRTAGGAWAGPAGEPTLRPRPCEIPE